nr:CMF_HP1_G0046390.mRNA.1.CDS.1 [Saccharomyces cerevisiae]
MFFSSKHYNKIHYSKILEIKIINLIHVTILRKKLRPQNANNANGNSLLQEHIRARFNKMKTIPQQMKNQSTVAKSGC